jgi:uncharacterized protein (TIGR03435 family)
MIPDSLSALWTAIAPAMANHLWQSTLFAAAAAVLTLALRKNPARVRYRLWLFASVKFLIPFSLLVSLGSHLAKPHGPVVVQSEVYSAVEEVSLPFTQDTAAPVVAPASPLPTNPAGSVPSWQEILAALWMCGFVATVGLWLWRWRQAAACLRRAAPMPQGREVDALRQLERALSSQSPLAMFLATGPGEPGVFGIFRPVLLWPAGISKHLQDNHVEAILAHEVAHVRRRDNLTAAMHMLVEAIFWFHPLVWWLGARLAEERERACDEEVLQLGKSAQVYAESILKTCEFCVASPLACVSGVTGADLKKRIVRIMTEADRAVRHLDFTRKLLLCVAGIAGVASPIVFGLAHITQVRAQATPGNTHPSQGIAGTWQGTLHARRDLRAVVKITKGDDGGYKAVFYSIDQGGDGLPATKITMDGSTVKMTLTMIGGTYEGKVSADSQTITGNLTQGQNPLPLVLTRATPETEWTIPPPRPRIPPMDANASPTFEVVTIKPAKPDEQRTGITVDGRRLKVFNQSLSQLISFSYGVQGKQIIGLSPWAESDKFDIDAEPDGEGMPNLKQWKSMIQKMIAERFKLAFHHDEKELPVYVLSVAKNGPKLNKSEDQNGLPGLFFRGRPGDLGVRNATMSDFTGLMQEVVLDRPVVDHTGITGKWDFTLDWTPDDSQFAGAKMPPPADNTNPPPDLYTAIQEQIGLKLDATKASADVLIVDHVEKPSEN